MRAIERKEDESPHTGGCVLGHRGQWGDRWQARAGWNLAACCRKKPKKSGISLDVEQEHTQIHTDLYIIQTALHHKPMWKPASYEITQCSQFKCIEGGGGDL